MAAILSSISESFNYVFYELCDPRTRDWFPSPLFLIIIELTYLLVCKILGPALMKNVKPFKLKTIIFYYNIFQVLISAYVFYEGLLGGWLNGYSLTCQALDMSDTPITRRMAYAIWLYTIVKLIDMLDTVFFVLRKKDRQISFLHVFHHFMMPIASYIALKYFPNGHATLLGVINCLVHVVMYTYYLISGLGPKYQKYLWWKKHLTTMQLVQFGIIFIHNLSAIYHDCGYPRWISALLCIHSLQFLYMFGNFYYVSYIKTNTKTDHQNGSLKPSAGKSKVN